VLDRLDYPYPHLASSSVRAVLGASEAKRAFDPFADEHQPAGQPHYRPTFDPPAVLTLNVPGITPQERGTLTHRVLEHLDFSRPIEDELRRLAEASVLTAEQVEAIDADALRWFAETPLGQRMRRAGAAGYRREVSFITAEPAWLFDPALEGLCDDTVLVRGIIDGMLNGDDGPEIIDFKTDAVDAAGAEQRAEQYALQLRLYVRAVGRIWRRPVARAWLVFLTPRRIIEAATEQEVS
jgi:ATP-dependent helicase/nuclease subunit A